MLKVNTAVMQSQCDTWKEIVKRLDEVAQDVSTANQRLNWDVAVNSQVRQVLGQHSENLIQLSNQANTLHKVLMDAIEQYTQVEQRNSGDGKGAVQTVASGQGSGGGGLRDEDEKIDWKDFVTLIKNFLDAIGELGELGPLKVISSIMALLLAIFGMGGVKGASFGEIVHLLSDTAKEGFGAYSSVGNMLVDMNEAKFKELGLSDRAAIAGVVSGFLGIVSAVGELQDMSLPEALQNAQELMESASTMGLSFWNIINDNPITGLTGKIWEATFGSISVAATSFVGDAMEFFADGQLTLDEIAKIGVNGSSKGLATMVKILSFGVVDVDGQQVSDNLEAWAQYLGRKLAKH